MYSHFDCVSFNTQFHHPQLGATFDEEFDQLLTLFDPMLQPAILRVKDGNIPSWLSVLPLARSQFDLSAQEFRDSLIRSHCCLYLLYVMVVEHHLILSMPLIVAMGLGHS